MFEGSLLELGVWAAGALIVVALLWGYWQRRSLREQLKLFTNECTGLKNENRRLKADCQELRNQVTAAGIKVQAQEESLQGWKSRTARAEERAADPAAVMAELPRRVQVFRPRDGDDRFVEQVVAYLEIVLGVDIHPAVVDTGRTWQEQFVETEDAVVTAVVSW